MDEASLDAVTVSMFVLGLWTNVGVVMVQMTQQVQQAQQKVQAAVQALQEQTQDRLEGET